MQLIKERKFGNLISDTFTFFKEYGKNYFKNYFALNGALLLLFVVVFIFGYREFFIPNSAIGKKINFRVIKS